MCLCHASRHCIWLQNKVAQNAFTQMVWTHLKAKIARCKLKSKWIPTMQRAGHNNNKNAYDWAQRARATRTVIINRYPSGISLQKKKKKKLSQCLYLLVHLLLLCEWSVNDDGTHSRPPHTTFSNELQICVIAWKMRRRTLAQSAYIFILSFPFLSLHVLQITSGHRFPISIWHYGSSLSSPFL